MQEMERKVFLCCTGELQPAKDHGLAVGGSGSDAASGFYVRVVNQYGDQADCRISAEDIAVLRDHLKPFERRVPKLPTVVEVEKAVAALQGEARYDYLMALNSLLASEIGATLKRGVS